MAWGILPRLFGKKIGETIYSLNLLPFGAFVSIQGEEGGGSVEDAKSLVSKPGWQRAAVLFGGVLAFWIVAAILLSFVFGFGVLAQISDSAKGESFKNPRVLINMVAPDSPAEEAGIKAGDSIVKIKNQKASEAKLEKKSFSSMSKVKNVGTVTEVQEFTEANKGEEVVLTIKRGNEVFGKNFGAAN